MLKKISLPILLTVMCALLLGVVLLYGFNTGKFTFLQKKAGNQNLVQTEEEVKITRTDYTEVARKTLDWIDKQRNEEGWYILERGCDYEKKTCETVWDNKEGNKDGLIATWARLNFYEQHKDPKDLEIVKKDIDLFYEKYKDDNLKDSLWMCKITYEMAQSKYLDQGQKDKLEKICFGLEIPEVITNKADYIKRLEKVNATLKEGVPSWSSWTGYSLGLRLVDSYFGLTSDLVSQYAWKKDETKLTEAKKYFESAKEIVRQMDVSANAEDDCLVGLAAVDLYEFGSKDEGVLSYAKEKYISFLNEKGKIKKYRTTICGLFSKELYQVTKNNSFFDDMEKNNRVLVEGLWDGDESFAKTISDNGFYMASVGGGGFPLKNVVENGLIVELIRD